ncbi:hypothetical protein AOQ84DRAFT_285221 [Glonium stellatum]|uniref:Transcription factor domain-containing protein n=1 Tax=Glonium stellatum TaxID=574774 RepID=A0A8E2F8W5_9PEZI|nr:hypothetical protein AOQ84DRAFT_285221 [Glonium stellatum]
MVLTVFRLNRLERTVNDLVRRLGDDSASEVGRSTTTEVIRKTGIQTEHNPPSVEPALAPLFVLRDVATEAGVRPPDRTRTNTPARDLSQDIIMKGFLTENEALPLLSLFNEHYGRWVAFSPTISLGTLLTEVRRSPLLLAACCLIAVRHTTQGLASRLAPQLFKEAKSLLSTALLSVPQPIEFFQAALVLSMWSTTIGRVPLSIDSWLLGGFALQHSLASSLFQPVTNISSSTGHTKHELDRWCIWNHLCLAHLHYCVGTRRKSLIDRDQVNRCRDVLDSDHATNYESRMVAEVNLYWIIYESCSVIPVDLPKTQAVLHTWREEWKWLFDQPRSQFLQMGFHFAQLLIYDQSLKSRSAFVRESLLSEMVRLSTAIINLAMETTDERTRHLTDHIYHMISFAAVTLCRLLHLYEEQLSALYDIVELDRLVLQLVSWLHSIGLPCHVAHTLGDVVAAFHKKLRPDAQPSPTASYLEVDFEIQEDYSHMFPELFGATSFDGNIGHLLPDWGPVL